jgi:hypothetical protein
VLAQLNDAEIAQLNLQPRRFAATGYERASGRSPPKSPARQVTPTRKS